MEAYNLLESTRKNKTSELLNKETASTDKIVSQK